MRRHGVAARFEAEDLDNERQIVLEEIAMYEDDPQDKVFDVLGEAIFGAHPLGRAIIGRADVVARHAGRRRSGRLPRRSATCPQNVVRRGGRLRGPRRARRARARVRRPPSALPAFTAPPAPPPPDGAGRARALRAQGHRAVPRVPRRAGHRARRRAPLRAARPGQRPRRHVVLAAVPGGARAPRAGLQRLLVQRHVRGHRAGRPLRRHPARQRRRGAGRRRRRARPLRAPTRRTADELDRAQGERQGPRRCSRSSRPPRG